MLAGFIKILFIHLISIVSGIILWIYIYINGMEQYELAIKLNISLPPTYIIIGKNNDLSVRVIIETNRKYKEYLNNNYQMYKKIKVKGRIFPKKLTIKISEHDIHLAKLPKMFKIVNIVDKNITINCDVLKEVILPIQLQSVIYKGDEIKNYIASFDPDYVSMKVPSGFARVTKAIYLNPLNLNGLPTKPSIFSMPIPEQFRPYIEEKIQYINVTINVLKPVKETSILVPIKLLVLAQTIQSKIKTLKVYPDSVQITIEYPADFTLSDLKKHILCYIEVKKITHSIQSLPINCMVKNNNTKLKITDISKTSAEVIIYKKKN